VKKMTDDNDVIAELERIDRFYDGDEPGDRPLEVLRSRGIEIPDESSLDDETLTRKLWELVEAMATMGMYLESTDHLSDRELYRYLVTDGLREETILSDSPLSAWHLSPIGGCSEEDNLIYLRYYADDEERADWEKDSGEPLPPKEPPRADRDSRLPQHNPHFEAEVQ
jgi:hypothetical protein